MEMNCDNCGRIAGVLTCPACGNRMVCMPQDSVPAAAPREPYQDNQAEEIIPFGTIDNLDVGVMDNMQKDELAAYIDRLKNTMKALREEERLCRERMQVLKDMLDEAQYILEE